MAWAALGLRPDARPADVKRAYRKLLRAYHPDTGTGDADLLNKVQALYRQVTESWAGRDSDARARAAAAPASDGSDFDARRTSPLAAYRFTGTPAPATQINVLA